MRGKERYGNYLQGKLESIRKSGNHLWAEIAFTEAFGAGPCVVIAQGAEDDLLATLLIEIKDGKIVAMTMTDVPSPNKCRRTWERSL